MTVRFITSVVSRRLLVHLQARTIYIIKLQAYDLPTYSRTYYLPINLCSPSSSLHICNNRTYVHISKCILPDNNLLLVNFNMQLVSALQLSNTGIVT
jgi:hypothetical protein